MWNHCIDCSLYTKSLYDEVKDKITFTWGLTVICDFQNMSALSQLCKSSASQLSKERQEVSA